MTSQNQWKKIFLVLALLAACLAIPAASWAAARETTLVIIHTNDLHGHLKPHIYKRISEDREVGGAAYLAALIEKIRQEYPGQTLLLDAGDVAQGTPISNAFFGEPTFQVMNYLKYDAVTLGNHEFDWKLPALLKMVREAQYPVLSANIVRADSPGRHIEGVKPFIIKEVNGVRVGILGLTTVKTPFQTTDTGITKELKFLDPVATAREYIPIMKNQGASFIVLLSHLGFDQDRDLAQRVRGIDVIVGGHGHTELQDPVKVEKTIILQAGSYGHYVGKLVLGLDPVTREIRSYNEKDGLILVDPAKLTPDPNVLRIVRKYDSRIQAEMSRVIGSSMGDITRRRSDDSFDMGMGNLICDALVSQMGSDAAILNNGGIRSDIYRGDITLESIYNALPFENYVVAFDISGKSLKNTLEVAFAGVGCQVSGITFDVDMNKPEGSRISNVMVKGEALEPGRTYRLATVDFLLRGGDNYVFEGTSNLYLGPVIRSALADYIKGRKNLSPPPLGRTRKIDSSKDKSKTK
jgi:2',3'-cyclic-nucleotide 2'-phosphodiesterase (5'-nucleotidase family)